MRGAQVSSYLRFGMESLPAQIGTTIQDPITQKYVRRSDGSDGYLSFGPHILIGPGSYIAGFYVKRLGPTNDNAVIVDVVTDLGETEIARKRLPATTLFDDLSSFVSLPFTARDALENLEVRLFVEDGVAVEVHDLTIFRSDELSWKSRQ